MKSFIRKGFFNLVPPWDVFIFNRAKSTDCLLCLGIKRFEVRDFSLGEAPPLLDCFQVVKIKKSAEADGEIEELALQTNFTYFNGVSFVLSVSHVLGVADLSVAISQLSGPAIFGKFLKPQLRSMSRSEF